jgi:DNA mismatch endonuclease (patch repair protein)
MSRSAPYSSGGSRAAWDGVDPLRRRIMKANPGRDTRPELALRSALHKAGLRYRTNLVLDVAGKRLRPDIAFTQAQLAVFVDGCFWHGCPMHGSRPKTRPEYWVPKIEATRARDALAVLALREVGWTTLRIWEHEAIEDAAALVTRTLDALRAQGRRRARPSHDQPLESVRAS